MICDEEKTMEQSGLIRGFILDGKGGGQEIGWEELKTWSPENGPLWLHFDYTSENTTNWIQHESDLDEVPATALLTEETRPRTTVLEDGTMIALRGVNLNPGSDPEDMVSIRLWVEENRVISTRKRPLLSTRYLAESLQKNKGPKTTGELIVNLTDMLTDRMEDTIENIEDRLAELEERITDSGDYELRNTLSNVRREAIMLRRYLAPQREALIKLHSEHIPWLTTDNRIKNREVTDQLVRYLEDLDSVRDRAAVTQEELINRISEQMNTRMYVLSLVAAVFLPLSFLTGLLGINVGGIPGSNHNWAFLTVVLMMIGVAIFEILLFRRKKWL